MLLAVPAKAFGTIRAICFFCERRYRPSTSPPAEVCSQPAYVLNCNAGMAPTCYGAHPYHKR